MDKINLDLGKLLGFRIIADRAAPGTLHSPKIGVKGCTVASEATMPVRSGALLAKIGQKPG